MYMSLITHSVEKLTGMCCRGSDVFCVGGDVTPKCCTNSRWGTLETKRKHLPWLKQSLETFTLSGCLTFHWIMLVSQRENIRVERFYSTGLPWASSAILRTKNRWWGTRARHWCIGARSVKQNEKKNEEVTGSGLSMVSWWLHSTSIHWDTIHTPSCSSLVVLLPQFVHLRLADHKVGTAEEACKKEWFSPTSYIIWETNQHRPGGHNSLLIIKENVW